MTIADPGISTANQPFTPKLFNVLAERYRLADFRADLAAGLTVAIVALPLSMAIAIASGVTPDRGLTAAIVGGFFVSALGGSRVQIGGPAGAFIVLVAATVAAHGIEGLLVATLLAGLFLIAMGLLRLGTYVRYVPYPVTVGFTAGIAVIIAASQIKEALGLSLAGPEPGALVPKLAALGAVLPTAAPAAIAVTLLVVVLVEGLRRRRPRWPSYLVAVGLATLLAWALHLPVATIGTRFGGIPGALPRPHLPPLSFDTVVEMLPSAAAFAILGSIESLLSAVVADGMTGRRHRSNCELVAQGVANIASALFGGLCVTGTIARTATNVRSGGRTPFAGMMHAAFVLAFMLVAAPLAAYIPLAALAGVLIAVAWNMAERHAFATLMRASRADATVLLATFALVVFRDLIQGIVVGFALSALLVLHRLAQDVEVASVLPPDADTDDDGEDMRQTPIEAATASDPDLVVFRISGAFFFGAAASVSTALDRSEERPRAFVLELSGVRMLDSTGAATIAAFVRKARANAAAVYLCGVGAPIRRLLELHGVAPPAARFEATLDAAIPKARRGEYGAEGADLHA